jgi:hypothetical protein
MSTKSPECYTSEPQARCLRVEISPGRSLLLPLDQFAFAEFISNDKEQQLHLVFATHEVLISGYALRRIETAMHRLELASIMTLPVKYQPLIADGQPKIREIAVTEAKAASLQSEASLN